MAELDAVTRAAREAHAHDGPAASIHTVAFDAPDRALIAVQRLHDQGFAIVDVHSPFPIHGLDAALGWRETRLPWATFIGGAFGVTAGLALALAIHAHWWPLNIGGKSNSAIPAIIPVVFELGVLFAAFATVFGLLFRRRLWPQRPFGDGPGQPGLGVTDDRFVILVLERDGAFCLDRFRATVAELEPIEVVESWRVL